MLRSQDWNFTTVAQSGLGGRSILYERGHVLGGSTAVSKCIQSLGFSLHQLSARIIDFMAYCRGSKDDWNRWAKVTGDQGWSWNNIIGYAKKVRLPFLVCGRGKGSRYDV